MEKPIYMHDVDCLPFFRNVVHSKLLEAQQHLKKVELYKHHLEPLSPYFIDDIVHIYDEQSDFITIAQAQVAVWRKQGLGSGQANMVKDLENMIKTLDSITYHILYLVEHIQRAQNPSADEGDERSEEYIALH